MFITRDTRVYLTRYSDEKSFSRVVRGCAVVPTHAVRPHRTACFSTYVFTRVFYWMKQKRYSITGRREMCVFDWKRIHASVAFDTSMNYIVSYSVKSTRRYDRPSENRQRFFLFLPHCRLLLVLIREFPSLSERAVLYRRGRRNLNEMINGQMTIERNRFKRVSYARHYIACRYNCIYRTGKKVLFGA